MVPALIESVKVAGLVLVSDTSAESTGGSGVADSYAMPDGIDGLLRGNGVLRFNETIDM
jgi:CDK inhibitor PHO81